MKKRFFTYENGIVTLMALIFGCLFFDRLALNFLMPFVSKDLQLSDTQIGLIAAGLSLAWAVSGYFVASWAETNNRKKIVYVISVMVFSLCSFGTGIAISFLTLLLVRLVMGLSEGAVIPLSQNFVLKESSSKRFGLNAGILQATGSGLFGSILAPVVLVPLALKFGWRNAFFIAGIPGLILAFIAWFYIKKSTAESNPNVKNIGLSVKELWQIKNIRYCLGLTCCLLGWWFATLPFISNYFVKVQGMSPDEMSKTMGILGVSGLLSGIIVPALTDKFGRKPILLLFMIAGIFYPFAVQFLTGSALHIPMMFLTYFAMGCIPIAIALIPAATVPEHSQAKAIGLMMGVGEIVGGVLVPALSGALSDAINPAAFLWVAAVAAILGVFFTLGLTELTSGSKNN